jgi:hypothetical protein
MQNFSVWKEKSGVSNNLETIVITISGAEKDFLPDCNRI